MDVGSLSEPSKFEAVWSNTLASLARMGLSNDDHIWIHTAGAGETAGNTMGASLWHVMK